MDRRVLEPGQFGVRTATLADLKGGDALENRDIARGILSGEGGPRRDIVLVNASAALVSAGRAASFAEGMSLAADSIDSGALRKWVREHFCERVMTKHSLRCVSTLRPACFVVEISVSART